MRSSNNRFERSRGASPLGQEGKSIIWSLNGLCSTDDLAKLGLSLEAAVDRRFTFFSPDLDKAGNPDDIMFNGVVIYDHTLGYLASPDSDGFYWRSEMADHDP